MERKYLPKHGVEVVLAGKRLDSEAPPIPRTHATDLWHAHAGRNLVEALRKSIHENFDDVTMATANNAVEETRDPLSESGWGRRAPREAVSEEDAEVLRHLEYLVDWYEGLLKRATNIVHGIETSDGRDDDDDDAHVDRQLLHGLADGVKKDLLEYCKLRLLNSRKRLEVRKLLSAIRFCVDTDGRSFHYKDGREICRLVQRNPEWSNVTFFISGQEAIDTGITAGTLCQLIEKGGIEIQRLMIMADRYGFQRIRTLFQRLWAIQKRSEEARVVMMQDRAQEENDGACAAGNGQRAWTTGVSLTLKGQESHPISSQNHGVSQNIVDVGLNAVEKTTGEEAAADSINHQADLMPPVDEDREKSYINVPVEEAQDQEETARPEENTDGDLKSSVHPSGGTSAVTGSKKLEMSSSKKVESGTIDSAPNCVQTSEGDDPASPKTIVDGLQLSIEHRSQQRNSGLASSTKKDEARSGSAHHSDSFSKRSSSKTKTDQWNLKASGLREDKDACGSVAKDSKEDVVDAADSGMEHPSNETLDGGGSRGVSASEGNAMAICNAPPDGMSQKTSFEEDLDAQHILHDASLGLSQENGIEREEDHVMASDNDDAQRTTSSDRTQSMPIVIFCNRTEGCRKPSNHRGKCGGRGIKANEFVCVVGAEGQGDPVTATNDETAMALKGSFSKRSNFDAIRDRESHIESHGADGTASKSFRAIDERPAAASGQIKKVNDGVDLPSTSKEICSVRNDDRKQKDSNPVQKELQASMPNGSNKEFGHDGTKHRTPSNTHQKGNREIDWDQLLCWGTQRCRAGMLPKKIVESNPQTRGVVDGEKSLAKSGSMDLWGWSQATAPVKGHSTGFSWKNETSNVVGNAISKNGDFPCSSPVCGNDSLDEDVDGIQAAIVSAINREINANGSAPAFSGWESEVSQSKQGEVPKVVDSLNEVGPSCGNLQTKSPKREIGEGELSKPTASQHTAYHDSQTCRKRSLCELDIGHQGKCKKRARTNTSTPHDGRDLHNSYHDKMPLATIDPVHISKWLAIDDILNEGKESSKYESLSNPLGQMLQLKKPLSCRRNALCVKADRHVGSCKLTCILPKPAMHSVQNNSPNRAVVQDSSVVVASTAAGDATKPHLCQPLLLFGASNVDVLHTARLSEACRDDPVMEASMLLGDEYQINKAPMSKKPKKAQPNTAAAQQKTKEKTKEKKGRISTGLMEAEAHQKRHNAWKKPVIQTVQRELEETNSPMSKGSVSQLEEYSEYSDHMQEVLRHRKMRGTSEEEEEVADATKAKRSQGVRLRDGGCTSPESEASAMLRLRKETHVSPSSVECRPQRKSPQQLMRKRLSMDKQDAKKVQRCGTKLGQPSSTCECNTPARKKKRNGQNKMDDPYEFTTSTTTQKTTSMEGLTENEDTDDENNGGDEHNDDRTHPSTGNGGNNDDDNRDHRRRRRHQNGECGKKNHQQYGKHTSAVDQILGGGGPDAEDGNTNKMSNDDNDGSAYAIDCQKIKHSSKLPETLHKRPRPDSILGGALGLGRRHRQYVQTVLSVQADVQLEKSSLLKDAAATGREVVKKYRAYEGKRFLEDTLRGLQRGSAPCSDGFASSSGGLGSIQVLEHGDLEGSTCDDKDDRVRSMNGDNLSNADDGADKQQHRGLRARTAAITTMPQCSSLLSCHASPMSSAVSSLSSPVVVKSPNQHCVSQSDDDVRKGLLALWLGLNRQEEVRKSRYPQLWQDFLMEIQVRAGMTSKKPHGICEQLNWSHFLLKMKCKWLQHVRVLDEQVWPPWAPHPRASSSKGMEEDLKAGSRIPLEPSVVSDDESDRQHEGEKNVVQCSEKTSKVAQTPMPSNMGREDTQLIQEITDNIWRRQYVPYVRKKSKIHGYGLFATEEIPANCLISIYDGELVDNVEADRREAEYNRRAAAAACNEAGSKMTCSIENDPLAMLTKEGDCYMFRADENWVVDATQLEMSAARYINHSCCPNCVSQVIQLSSGRPVVIIKALKDIISGEELCYNYHFDEDPGQPVPQCHCGSLCCAGRIDRAPLESYDD